MNFRIKLAKHLSIGPSGPRFLAKHFTIGRSGLLLKGRHGSVWIPTNSAPKFRGEKDDYRQGFKFLLKFLILLYPFMVLYCIRVIWIGQTHPNYSESILFLAYSFLIAITFTILHQIFRFFTKPSRFERKFASKHQFID